MEFSYLISQAHGWEVAVVNVSYLLQNPQEIGLRLGQHLQMVGLALAISILLAFPLGLLITRFRWLTLPIMGTLGILYTVPSLALIILLVPILGLNARSVVAAMVIYAQIILVRNITVGLRAIKPEILEAARGMGMNAWQRWWQVQVPLALPVFLAGIRLASVISIAIATIGAKFGAGGLGVLLFDGIAQSGRYDKIWAGSLVVAGLALTINAAFLGLEWAARARYLKLR
jgi:osmoprotectant transport system permease protein